VVERWGAGVGLEPTTPAYEFWRLLRETGPSLGRCAVVCAPRAAGKYAKAPAPPPTLLVPASGSFFAYRLVDFFLLRPLRPVASATAPTAPDTALTAFRPTFLAVVPTPDAPRLLEPRFFALEVRAALEDFDRFLGDDLEPAAAPRDFLALRAGMFPSSNVCRGNSCAVTCCSSRLVA